MTCLKSGRLARFLSQDWRCETALLSIGKTSDSTQGSLSETRCGRRRFYLGAQADFGSLLFLQSNLEDSGFVEKLRFRWLEGHGIIGLGPIDFFLAAHQFDIDDGTIEEACRFAQRLDCYRF